MPERDKAVAMPWETESEVVDTGVRRIHAWNDDRDIDRHVVFTIDTSAEEVVWYPRELSLDAVTFEGFRSVPEPLREAGYIPRSLETYLDTKLSQANVGELVVSSTRDSSIRKIRNEDSFRMVLSYKDFKEFDRGFLLIDRERTRSRRIFADEFFYRVFPRRFDAPKESTGVRARRVMENLDAEIIDDLGPQDLDRLLDFVSLVLSTRYTTRARRSKLLGAAKIRVEKVALTDVISEFEELLQSNPAESQWGRFLQDNLFLIDSKYVGVLPELNVVLASQRKADFGLVDMAGYLDLFEIKKPSTHLLSQRKDRGNHYWHSQAVKALVQAEKYLFNANRKATALAEDIHRERGIDVRVVRPRAVVVMGDTRQLTNDEMKSDFRVLRESLKNLEIVCYDELLERLRNQARKDYADPHIPMGAD